MAHIQIYLARLLPVFQFLSLNLVFPTNALKYVDSLIFRMKDNTKFP